MTRRSDLEEVLVFQIKAVGLPEPTREYRFAPPRRWRFDFAWPVHTIAVEVEGGTFVGGSHNRALRFQADCEKYNTAQIMGWRVLRFDNKMVEDGRAISTIEEAMKA